MLCPRCVDKTVLVENVGALGEAACPACQARFLDDTDTAYVLEELAGTSRATLVDDSEGAPQMGPCPACHRSMSQLVVENQDVWLCRGCGASSLASGALAALSRGRFAEPVVAHRGGDGAVGVVSREPVKGEVLAAAFAEARFRTAVDAHAAGDRGHGLIAERATRVEADAVVTALVRHGVPAEMVEGALLALPRAIAVRVATVDDEVLSVDAHPSQPLRVPWADVTLVAVGTVRVPTVTEQRRSGRYDSFLGRPTRPKVQAVHSHVDDVLLEVFTPTLRLKTSAHTLELSRADGVSVETAFRAFARSLLSKIPPGAMFAADSAALRDNTLARLTLHRAKSWEDMLTWARWRGP